MKVRKIDAGRAKKSIDRRAIGASDRRREEAEGEREQAGGQAGRIRRMRIQNPVSGTISRLGDSDGINYRYYTRDRREIVGLSWGYMYGQRHHLVAYAQLGGFHSRTNNYLPA